MPETSPMKQLLATLPQVGRVEWIGLRPARKETVLEVPQAEVNVEQGLIDDHYKGRPGGKRQVTLIQQEHLAVVAGCLHRDAIDPALLRRNVVVSGLNLLALKDKTFRVGDAVLEYTGLCHPCSRMETNLGPGGYNAMRGHGGITARVLAPGRFAQGDAVQMLAVKADD